MLQSEQQLRPIAALLITSITSIRYEEAGSRAFCGIYYISDDDDLSDKSTSLSLNISAKLI